MTKIPSNFSNNVSEKKCYCGSEEKMEHIYYCKVLSDGKKKKLKYEKIYNGTLQEQIEVFKEFDRNMKKRESMKNENSIPCGLSVDPLSNMTAMGK